VRHRTRNSHRRAHRRHRRLLRIHRDTRFSRDKSPYKANISGLFWEGPGKKTESPAFGFQVEPDGMGLMAGIFAFPPPQLERYREAVLDEQWGSDLAARLAAVQRTDDYTLGGEALKRVPNGYDPAHPRADLLRQKGLYIASPRIWPDEIITPGLVDRCFDHFQRMAPIQQWLAAFWQRG
jgi:uncharacterized protein (TIGR02453 family)